MPARNHVLQGANRWTATVIGMAGILLWATETSLVSLTGGLPTFEIVALAFTAATFLSPLAWWITGERPTLAFRQRPAVWLITVPSLVGYHACIYFCVHRVPAAPAALLQGCTPLFIVLGAALLPGQRLRWWHIFSVGTGMIGLIDLSTGGRGLAVLEEGDASIFLGLIGFAAGLWGVYSLVSSRFGSVPTSAMGVFYAASALVAFICHSAFETWITPTGTQGMAVAALGLLPMGLALYCWDFGLKRGDVPTLGVVSYVEPLIGAGLVVALGQGQLEWSMLLPGLIIIGSAALGSANFLDGEQSPEPLPTTILGFLNPELRLWAIRIAAEQGAAPDDVALRHVEAWQARRIYLEQTLGIDPVWWTPFKSDLSCE